MSATHGSSPRCRAFTLVELLVVIGIISLLISILLPALGRVRESAQTVKCLSNLRQIGIGIVQYANANDGYMVPAYVIASPGGQFVDTYATLLVRSKFVAAPDGGGFGVLNSADTLFRCPSGIDERSNGSPVSKTDAQGARYWQPTISFASNVTTADPGNVIHTWYGLNGISLNPANPDAPKWQQIFPLNDLWIQTVGNSATGPAVSTLQKLSRLKRSSEMVLVFDGVLMHGGNANRINARHNRQKVTNLLMADGHAESVNTRETPTSLGGPNRGSLGNTPSFPRAKWRLDQ